MGDLYFVSSIRVNLRMPTLNDTFLSRWEGYGDVLRIGVQTRPMLVQSCTAGGAPAAEAPAAGDGEGGEDDADAAEGGDDTAAGDAEGEGEQDSNIVAIPEGATTIVQQ